MPTDDPIDVVLCDDSEAFRRLLGLQLADDDRFRVVGEAACAEECAPAVGRAAPDIVLLDHGIVPTGAWETFVDELRSACPRTRVVLYSGLPLDVLEHRARAGGLDGFLHKDEPLEVLCSKLSSVAAEAATGRGA